MLNHPLATGTCCGIEPCSSQGQKAKTCRVRTGCHISNLTLFHLPIKPASRVKPKNIYFSLTRAVRKQVSACSMVEQWLSSSRRQHGDAPGRMSPLPPPRPQQISSSLLSQAWCKSKLPSCLPLPPTMSSSQLCPQGRRCPCSHVPGGWSPRGGIF